ncbi:hypothetical protein ACFB49_30120 [Sphingomonas sp. DBB INV C78]|uniref:helix-turn-helix transcriptional regulator n=1 Tax=Sphingomonas sp. DBB INV C78 TaxID=3349434 RepID=UPI0036D2DAE2
MRENMIAAIYDAPIAERPWAGLAGRVREAFEGSAAMFQFARAGAPDGRTRFIFDSAWDAHESWPLYDSVYRHLDPTRHRAMEVGAVYDFAAMMPAVSVGEGERFLAFCRRIGADHALFAYLGEQQGVGGWLSISRDQARGPFGPNDAAELAGLVPHLHRALAIHARLDSQRNAAAIHAAALADLGVGVILLDQAGAILGTNALADALLDRGTAVARDGDRLKLRGQGGAALRRSLRQPAGGAMLVAGEAGGNPLHLLVRPWQDEEGDGAGPNYVVYLDSAADQPALGADALRRRFGLSLAEARMAALLVRGLSVDACAAAMGLTRTSARTYCKRLLARMGAERQADLIRMILSSVARLDRPH